MIRGASNILSRSGKGSRRFRALRSGLPAAVLAALMAAQVAHGQPTRLEITAIADQVSGVAFQVTVTAVDAGGVPTAVTQLTTVSLTRETGTGALGGGGNRNIAAGSSSTTYPAATWTTAGAGKSVRATATVGDLLAPAVSNQFAVTPGVAHHLTFTTQPATSTAGNNLLPVVAIRDINNNTVTTDDRTITLSFAVNPGGATLNGDVDLLTVNGVATWTAVEAMNITTAATGYRLQAGHDGAAFTGTQTVNSNAFNINAAAHHHLAFSTEPADTPAGNDLLPAVRIQDIYNNNCTAIPNRSITLSIIVNPSGAALNGTVTKTTASGIATWAAGDSLDITVPAVGYQLQATNTTAPLLPGGDTVDSAAFTISHNVADHMDFTTQPTSSAAGIALLPAVTIEDAYDNPCTSDNRNITLDFFANPGGAVLNGTLTVLSVNGVATWTGAEAMNITVAADGYQLQASHDGAAFSGSDTVNSAAFDISGGAAHHLAFTTQPTDPTTAGANLLPVVKIQDEYDNTVTGDDRTITLVLSNNPGGAALNGISSLVSVGGVATWTGAQSLNLTKAASGYQLQASHSGAGFAGSETVDSNVFDIVAASAHHLAFVTDPASGLAGDVLLPEVAIRDVYDNTVTGDERNITLTLMNAGGASLNGTTSLLTASGLAEWTVGQAMNITKPGDDYYLRASHDGAVFAGSDTADSSTFDVAHNVPHHLVFSTQPVHTTAGQALLPVITIQDLYDNTCTTDDRTITMSISTNPGGAALNGTVALASTSGVATWAVGQNMRINTAATGYTLRATGSGAFSGSDNVDSNAFNITAINVLSAFTVVPSANPVTVNNPITLTITARDSYDNAIPNYVTTQTINLTTTTGGDGTNIDWDNGPASLTDHLDGTADLAVGATFDADGELSLDITNRRAESITVTADDPTTPATGTSAAMSWDAWFALLLTFVPIAPDPTAGMPFDVDIEVTDMFGNLSNVTQDTDISLRLSAGTGTLGGTLDGTLTAGSNNTTISGATYDVAENNVVIIVDRISGDFLVAGTSDPFTVVGGDPVALVVQTIANQTAGVSFSVTVQAVDAMDNPAAVDADTDISLSLFTGLGILTGTTSGTITAGTSSVVINGVQLDTAQAAAVIRATRTSGDVLPAGDSNSFIVAANSPARLGISTITDQAASVAFAVIVRVYDDYDNLVGVTADTDVSLSLATGTGTLSGTLSQTLFAGSQSLTFSVSYDAAEAGVSFLAQRTSGNPLTQATSNVFTVNPSPPIRLDFLPINSLTANVLFNVTVLAVDLTGNEGDVLTDTDIEVSLNTGNGTLSAPSFTATIPAGSSRVTLTNFKYSAAENNVSLRAARTGGDILTDGISNLFRVMANTATYLRFYQQPTNSYTDTPITTSVMIVDATGNRSFTFSDITLSLVDPGSCGTTLEGTTTASGISGLAEFSVLVPQACTGYRLRATGPGVSTATSEPFDVVSATDVGDQDLYLPMDGDQTNLTITYVIPGTQTASPFNIVLGLEHDTTNDTPVDEVLATFTITATADRTPGEHTVNLGDVRPYLNGRVQQGDRVVIQIDPEDIAGAVNGGNKVVEIEPTVDLVSQSVVVNLHGDSPSASVTYVVNSLANVPPFTIRVGLDTDGDGNIDQTLTEATATEADVTPGTHVVTISLASAFDQLGIAAAGSITLIAVLDAGQSISENDDATNNAQIATATYAVDLAPSRLDHTRSRTSRDFDVTLTYEVGDNPVSEDFVIAFYAAADVENAIEPGNVRVAEFAVTDAADKTHGSHTRTFEIEVPATVYPNSDFVLKAVTDDSGTVNETDETNNVLAMPRFTPPTNSRLACGLGSVLSVTLSSLSLVALKAARRRAHTSPLRPDKR